MKYRVLPHLHEFDLIVVHFLTKLQVKVPTQKDDTNLLSNKKKKNFEKKKKKIAILKK